MPKKIAFRSFHAAAGESAGAQLRSGLGCYYSLVITLYKSAYPNSHEEGEFYQPNLDTELRSGKYVYFVREKHGWFDDTKKHLANLVVTLSPEEGFDTYEEAQKRYDDQVLLRVREGFVHSFTFNPFKEKLYDYKKL